MSTINVQFLGDFSNVPDVHVPVEIIDSSLETVAETTIPLGSPKAVEVSGPGIYLVRAALPSGERVSTRVTIPGPSDADPSPSATATLSPSDLSPHETEAWAYTVQGVRRAARSAPFVTAALSQEPSDSPADSGRPALTLTPAAAYRNMGVINSTFGLQFDPLTSSVAAPSTTNDPRVVLTLEINRTTLENTVTSTWSPSYQDVRGSLPPFRLLVAIPPLPRTRIVLVRSASHMTAHLVVPLVQGGDPRADALLSCLAHGAFADARAIGPSISDDELLEIISQKRKDPTSAVVSVYYQLRAGTTFRPEWVKNLADWFAFIPDGAIQYGWCLLRQAKPDYENARAYFLIAAKRGIPMYSYGVRLLYDGLNLFAERNPSDTEVSTSFLAVRRVAAVTDWRAAVTSLAMTGSPTSATAVTFGA